MLFLMTLAKMAFDEYCEAIAQCCDELGWDEGERQAWAMREFGKQSRTLLTDDELAIALGKLKE